jgi:hypothetical protein
MTARKARRGESGFLGCARNDREKDNSNGKSKAKEEADPCGMTARKARTRVNTGVGSLRSG